MIKVARKPSSDPVQEKLRQEKATWNKEVSTFVNDLIHLKKMMNGWPSKYYAEKSLIKEPIPSNPSTILDTLSGSYQDIAQKGNKIVQDQLNYSKTRKKKQMKQMNLPLGTPQPEPYAHIQDSKQDLSQQLALPMAGADLDYNLISEASSPVSRFFTRLLTPTWGSSQNARIRKYRMSLLKACAKTFKELGLFQVQIVGSSSQSIIESNKMLHKIWNDWNLVTNGFIIYKSNMPKDIEDTGGDIKSKDREEIPKETNEETTAPSSPDKPEPGDFDHEPKDGEDIEGNVAPTAPSSVIVSAQQAMADCFNTRKDPNAGLLFTDPNILNKIIDLNSRFKMAKSNEEKQKIAMKVVMEHQAILHQANKKHNIAASSLDQLLKALIAKNNVTTANVLSTQLEKVAQNFLKKWLGKKRHEFITNETSPYRLDMLKMTEEVRSDMNKLMDLLEKGMNVDEIGAFIIKIQKSMIMLKKIMRSLNFGEKQP